MDSACSSFDTIKYTQEATDAEEKDDRSLKDMNEFNQQHEEVVREMGKPG